MLSLRAVLLPFLFLLFMVSSAVAGNAVIASGAGYKKMVNALSTAYTEQTGQSVEVLFGNMARVTTLAKQSENVDIVLGDEFFLDKAALPLSVRQELGRGKLVLAFARLSSFSTEDDLDNAGRIALPDTHKAIYGKAARQYLQSSGRMPGIEPRLLEVSTVPQVFSYLSTNEVDMGFLNLTHALNVADKLGGYIVLDQDGYSPILILAGLLKESRHAQEARNFLRFLESPQARVIIKENGL